MLKTPYEKWEYDRSKIVKSNKNRDAIIARKQLGALMQNCITCHSSYRLPEPQ